MVDSIEADLFRFFVAKMRGGGDGTDRECVCVRVYISNVFEFCFGKCFKLVDLFCPHTV